MNVCLLVYNGNMSRVVVKHRGPHGRTRKKVFEVATELFFQHGYKSVGVRDIAKVVGIKSASLYNYFSSKDDLLNKLLRFYYDNYRLALLDLDEALKMIPTAAPSEVLEAIRLPMRNDQPYDMLVKIIIIAERECNNDARARAVIADMYQVGVGRITAVLDRMIERGVIEPLDTRAFASVMIRFGLSAGMEVDSKHLSVAEWQDGNKLLYGMIRLRK